MLEIDITEFASVDTWKFSHSIAEGGQSAGRDTWNASKRYASGNPLLANADERAEAVDYFAEFGAWEREELERMATENDGAEINALLLQYIAGNIRESGYDSLQSIVEEGAWEEYEARQEAGEVSSGIYRVTEELCEGIEVRYYFLMSH